MGVVLERLAIHVLNTFLLRNYDTQPTSVTTAPSFPFPQTPIDRQVIDDPPLLPRKYLQPQVQIP
jgi:hypothetical protein